MPVIGEGGCGRDDSRVGSVVNWLGMCGHGEVGQVGSGCAKQSQQPDDGAR